MTNLSYCTVPSLQPYLLHPLERQMSPYGVLVFQKLKEYVEGCDQHMMDTYLKQVSQNLGAILKRKRRGDQYGFSDDIDSDLHIMKNMDQKLLDDPDATRI